MLIDLLAALANATPQFKNYDSRKTVISVNMAAQKTQIVTTILIIHISENDWFSKLHFSYITSK